MFFARTLTFAALGLGLAACGGAKTTPQSSPNPDRETADTPGGAEDYTNESEAVAPTKPDCSDGTCFECGGGICPEGSYCDAGVDSAPACAWLPECSKSPTCSCISKVLGASCSCTEDGGGPQVTCQ